MRKTRKERKSIPCDCPICGNTYKNVYAMSAHKGHCSGATPKYRELPESSKNKRAWSRGKILKDPNTEIFIENSTCSTGYVKNVLVKLGYSEYKCQTCGIDEWMSGKLSLELDHISGDNTDNRLENIRLLCPNCHSQTPTWRGRNRGTNTKKVSDEKLKNAILNQPTISKALKSVGLSGGGNYKRAHIIRWILERDGKLVNEQKKPRPVKQKKSKPIRQVAGSWSQLHQSEVIKRQKLIKLTDTTKWGSRSAVATELGISHTQLRRFIKKYMKDFIS